MRIHGSEPHHHLSAKQPLQREDRISFHHQQIQTIPWRSDPTCCCQARTIASLRPCQRLQPGFHTKIARPRLENFSIAAPLQYFSRIDYKSKRQDVGRCHEERHYSAILDTWKCRHSRHSGAGTGSIQKARTHRIRAIPAGPSIIVRHCFVLRKILLVLHTAFPISSKPRSIYQLRQRSP
jgi:hypothetical protein